MMYKLKPCPFCGETEMIDIFGIYNENHEEIGCHITCMGCLGAFTQEEAINREEVVEAWNRRLADDCTV